MNFQFQVILWDVVKDFEGICCLSSVAEFASSDESATCSIPVL
jgi:hypothetical protein